MPTMLSAGPIHSITQNTVYALPAKMCRIFTDAAAPTLQQSLTEAFTANVAVTLSGGQADVAGAFLRVTSAGPINIKLSPLV